MSESAVELRDWHRLFGLLLTDFFTGAPFVVETERDLSWQQQILDALILRQGRGKFVGQLPDGLDGLVPHNLFTFKSHREALDEWAMDELAGHNVAYRKLVSPSPQMLLPREDFRRYAVCARFPHNLAQQIPWQELSAGVYDCIWGMSAVRVVVAGLLPQQPHNAPLHLFSASPELVEYGRRLYQRRSPNTSTLLEVVLQLYQREGVMPYTTEDFQRDYAKLHFKDLTPEERRELLQRIPIEERLAGLPPEVRLAGLPPEARLAGLPPEARLAGLPPEARLAGLPPEARLAGLSPEQIRAYLEQLTAKGSGAPSKPRRKKK